MIKMIALDLDNTLLNSDKKISSLNTKVLKKVTSSGAQSGLMHRTPVECSFRLC
ncbi:HAD family hydrolase [Fructilactobacillus florum]|uniref:HAD family hydrolase n=1 Tax=Fructilactobacillus florum TaxID=640331 RepID=UPI000B0ADC8C